MKPKNYLVTNFGVMRISVCALVSLLLLGGLSVAQAQQNNPLASDPRAAGAGGVIFRAQCATCHGADAKGIASIEAPDLTLIWTQDGNTDGSVFATIQGGIPGSIMPAHGFPDTEIWMLVSYLRSIATGGATRPFTGDADTGQRLFNANCAGCHRVGGAGSTLGPNLAGVTARRSQDSIASSIREPSASIGRGYKPISFLSVNQGRVQGVIKSEDAFSIQIMDSNQQLRGFMKSELSQMNREPNSLMPSFSIAELSDSELNDILGFLDQQR
jgi:putative heme-binding domain-containing protein